MLPRTPSAPTSPSSQRGHVDFALVFVIYLEPTNNCKNENDVFAVQREIAQSVAEGLKLTLNEGQKDQIAKQIYILLQMQEDWVRLMQLVCFKTQCLQK